jgi:hypothetical protein
MNRSNMATAVRNYLNELGTGEVTGTVIVNALDRSSRRINSTAKINKGDISIALQTGVREYSFPTAAMDVYRVRIGTGANRKRLEPTSYASLDREYGDWEAATAGTPTKYYTDGMIFGVYPKPHSTAAGTTVYVRCLQNPSPMANATTSPTWLPARWHDTIAKCAAIDLAGGFLSTTEGMEIKKSNLYQEYLEEVMQLKAISSDRSNEQTPRIRVTGYETFRR